MKLSIESLILGEEYLPSPNPIAHVICLIILVTLPIASTPSLPMSSNKLLSSTWIQSLADPLMVKDIFSYENLTFHSFSYIW